MNIEAKLRFAEIVKVTRGSLSQREFARKLGVHLGTVQGWEEGRSTPTTANLAKIASLTGYTLEELISYLGGEPLPQSSEVEQMVQKVHSLSLPDLATLARAVSDRLVSVAEGK